MLKIARYVGAPLILATALLSGTPIFAADATASPRVDQSRPTPVIYPTDAQKSGEQGNVVVNVYVNSGGMPSNVKIAQSSGYADLDNAALETVLNWHYLPGVRGGDTVSNWTQVNVVYKLSN
jgi:protein TonB